MPFMTGRRLYQPAGLRRASVTGTLEWSGKSTARGLLVQENTFHTLTDTVAGQAQLSGSVSDFLSPSQYHAEQLPGPAGLDSGATWHAAVAKDPTWRSLPTALQQDSPRKLACSLGACLPAAPALPGLNEVGNPGEADSGQDAPATLRE